MAVFVFMVILILFFGILSSMSEPEKGKRLSKNAEMITKALTGRTDQTILEDNKLVPAKVGEFIESGKYDKIKSELGLTGDFCIYIEDSNGNLIPVRIDEGDPNNPNDDVYVNGIGGEGSDGAVINGQKCGTVYTKTQPVTP
jgi:hypothetical protein